MRILVTNDDGINAPGLVVAEAIAGALAGSDGEVWTIAPAFEQSGVGHCISYTSPTMIAQLGERRFAAEGTPADCVMAALHHVMPHAPDLVISGVNRGNNAGENALYSGTLGGAMEAALQGLPGIALSAFLGPKNADQPFEAAAAHGTETVRRLWEAWPEGGDGYGLFWNVNFPALPGDDVRGLRVADQGYRGHGRMGMAPSQSPNGRTYLWVTGSAQSEGGSETSDLGMLRAGYIAATPMRADLTDHALLQTMAEKLG